MRRAVPALLLAPLVLAACGGGGSNDPAAEVTQAVTKSLGVPTGHVEQESSGTLLGRFFTVRGGGDFDRRRHIARSELRAIQADSELRIEEIAVGDALYEKDARVQRVLPKGKTWLKFAKDALNAPGLDFAALVTKDVDHLLTLFKSSRDVRLVGERAIGGVATAHYKGSLDLDALQKKAGTLPPGGSYAPYDLWVSKDDGYVRRFKLFYSEPEADTDGQRSVQMRFDLSGYGKKVHIALPPESETAIATTTMLQELRG